METREKAKELIDKMKLATDEFGYININKERHKQCALIAVDEIINNSIEWLGCKYQDEEIKYWQEVKQEIEKL